MGGRRRVVGVRRMWMWLVRCLALRHLKRKVLSVVPKQLCRLLVRGRASILAIQLQAVVEGLACLPPSGVQALAQIEAWTEECSLCLLSESTVQSALPPLPVAFATAYTLALSAHSHHSRLAAPVSCSTLPALQTPCSQAARPAADSIACQLLALLKALLFSSSSFATVLQRHHLQTSSAPATVLW